MADGVLSDLTYKVEGNKIIKFSSDEPSEEFVSKITFLSQDSLILIDHMKEERKLKRVFPKLKLTEVVDEDKKGLWETYYKGYVERYDRAEAIHATKDLDE